MSRLRLIGVLAHFPLYVAVGWTLTPVHPAAYVMLGCVALALAYVWPVADYFVVMALTTVSIVAAACLTAAAIAAAYLAVRVVEAMEEPV